MDLYKGFHVRDQADKAMVDSIYEADHYGIKKWAHTPFVEPGVMIDLGAHIGTFSKLWHELQPGSPILAVEAQAADCEVLRQNIGSFATIFNSTCTYCEWTPRTGFSSVTLDSLADGLYVDCLKIDVEAFEFNIFEEVEEETMERVMMVVGEVHDGDRGKKLLQQIFDERFPWFINFTIDHGLSHFSVYNPYYWYRRRCEL